MVHGHHRSTLNPAVAACAGVIVAPVDGSPIFLDSYAGGTWAALPDYGEQEQVAQYMTTVVTSAAVNFGDPGKHYCLLPQGETTLCKLFRCLKVH